MSNRVKMELIATLLREHSHQVEVISPRKTNSSTGSIARPNQALGTDLHRETDSAVYDLLVKITPSITVLAMKRNGPSPQKIAGSVSTEGGR
jgi:hypothetical protein